VANRVEVEEEKGEEKTGGEETGTKEGKGKNTAQEGIGVEATLAKMLVRLTAIEDQVGKASRITKVASQVSEPEQVLIKSMVGDGSCLYWALAAVHAMDRGLKVTVEDDLRAEMADFEAVKSDIIDNGMAWRDNMIGQGKDVDELWMNAAAEQWEVFGDKVLSAERLGSPENWGGHTEAMLYSWRQKTQIAVVQADEITHNMTVEQAIRHVVDCPWPDDDGSGRKKMSVIVLDQNHYYVLAVDGKGVFDYKGEYEKALRLGLEKIIAEKEDVPTFASIATISNRKERKEKIMERIARQFKKKKTEKKKKKATRKKSTKKKSNKKKEKKEREEEDRQEPEVKESWAQKARENGWQKVADHRQTRARKTTAQASTVSSVVIYTQQQAQELIEAIRAKDKPTANLIHSTRQKPGHVILMATREDDDELRECVQWLNERKFKASAYRFTDGALAQRASTGVRQRVQEVGLCHYSSNGNRCPFGAKGRCKFKCSDQRR